MAKQFRIAACGRTMTAAEQRSAAAQTSVPSPTMESYLGEFSKPAPAPPAPQSFMPPAPANPQAPLPPCIVEAIRKGAK